MCSSLIVDAVAMGGFTDKIKRFLRILYSLTCKTDVQEEPEPQNIVLY